MPQVIAMVETVFFFEGEVGYANHSQISFHNPKEYESDLIIADNWSLSSSEKECVLKAHLVTLSIPSGEYTQAAREIEVLGGGEGVRITGPAVWEGKIAGLEGGMSGVASFSASNIKVMAGTYMLPEEVEKNTELEYSQYHRRVQLHRLFSDDWSEEAREAACNRANPAWYEGIRKRDAYSSEYTDRYWKLLQYQDAFHHLAVSPSLIYPAPAGQERIRRKRQKKNRASKNARNTVLAS